MSLVAPRRLRVAKVVKTFGWIASTTETLDEFRYCRAPKYAYG